MQGEREGEPSSSQSLPAVAACLSFPPSKKKKNSNQNQQRIPLERVRES